MADPYAQFQDAQPDPYAHFADAPAPKKTKTSQVLGFEKGLLSPFARLESGVENALEKVGYPAAAINRATTFGGKSATENKNALASRYAKKEAGGVRPGKIGQAVGGAVASIPIGMATRNPMLAGGLSGAFTSEADDLGGTAGDAAIGAVAGKVSDWGLNKIADAVKPIVDPYVRKLADAGVRMTPGQVRGGKALVREDKMMSQPVVGDVIRSGRKAAREGFNTSTIDQALSPIGVKAPKGLSGHDAVAYAQDAVDEAYGAVLPKLNLQPDQQLSAEIQAAAQNVPRQSQKDFAQTIKTVLGNGNLQGRNLKAAQSELSRRAAAYGSSSNAYERELGRALGEVRNAFNDALERQNPQFAPDLAKVNKAFRGLATVERAAAKVADTGDFTPMQFLQAVRQSDTSRRKGATAAGQAYMQDWGKAGAQVLGGRTPDSGTAGRMQNGLVDNIRGGIAALGYGVDNALAAMHLAPRPAIAAPVGNALRVAGQRSGSVSGAIVPKPQKKKTPDRRER